MLPVAGLAAAAAAAALLLAVSSHACAGDVHDPAVFVQAGEGDRAVRSAALGYARDFTPVDAERSDPWSFFGEVVVGEWFNHHRDPQQRAGFGQFTVAPVVRYAFAGAARDLFVEVGVGASLIAPHFADHGRRFSTTFNFDDHAAFGWRFGERDANELSVRAEHFSNAGIRHPNPGQNFGQLRYARHF